MSGCHCRSSGGCERCRRPVLCAMPTIRDYVPIVRLPTGIDGMREVTDDEARAAFIVYHQRGPGVAGMRAALNQLLKNRRRETT